MPPITELITLALLGLLAWFWSDSSRAREAGVRAARNACAAENMQLLDDTVVLARIRLARNDDGQLVPRRVYHFEYSDTGDNRRPGSVELLGRRVLEVTIGLRAVPETRTLH